LTLVVYNNSFVHHCEFRRNTLITGGILQWPDNEETMEVNVTVYQLF